MLLFSFLLFTSVLNVLLHGTGFYLLFYLYKRGKGTPQRIFVMNLSLCELIQNICRMTLYVFIIANRSSNRSLGPGCMNSTANNITNTIFNNTTSTIFNITTNNNIFNKTIDQFSGFAENDSLLGSTLVTLIVNNREDASENTTSSIEVIMEYMMLITNSGVYYLCYTSMVLLTSDRLLCIWLHIGYRKFWTLRKTFASIASAWGLCSVVVIGLVTYAYVNNVFGRPATEQIFKKAVYHYTLTLLLTLFLIFAIGSYSLMFSKFLSSSRTTSSRRRSQNTIFYTFRHSRFFISVLLVVSYLLLMVIPNLVATTLSMAGITIPQAIYDCINVCSILSDTADGFIYVFLQTSVKRLLFRQTTLRRSTMSKAVSTNIPASPDFNGLRVRMKEMITSPRLRKILKTDNCTPSDTDDDEGEKSRNTHTLSPLFQNRSRNGK